MKENNHLDELFRSKLENFEQEPPSYVWSRIQEKQQGKKQRKLFLYMKSAGIAAALLLAFLFGWQLQQTRDGLSPALTETNPAVQPETETTSGSKQPETTASTGRDTTSPPQEQVQFGLASSSEKNQPHQGNKITGTKNENLVAENAANNHNSASEGLKQLQDDRPENRKQKTENLQLLRLLDARLTGSSDSRQLVGKVENKSKKASTLNSYELAMMNENAKLLADNRMDKRQGGWQVGAMLAPGLAINQTSQSQEYASNMAAPSSKEDLQLGGGISVAYKTDKRWSIQSGVYYSKLGQTSANQALSSFDGPQSSPVVGGGFAPVEAAYFNTSYDDRSGELLLNTSAGVVAIDNLPTNARLSNGFEALAKNDGILLNQTEFEQRFEYIEIPLIFRYQLIDATFDVQVMGGFSTSVLVGNNAYAKDGLGSERIGDTRDMNTFNYGTNIGLGFGYGITDKISIHVEPRLKYFLGSLNNNSNINFKPYTIGIYTGLSYQF